MLHTFLMIIHFFCAAAIVALVLLQRGKGAEAGAGFGAGASGTVFGARGAATALSRATAILAAIFMVTSLSLAYVGTRKNAAPSSGILDQFAQPQPNAPATQTPPATGSVQPMPLPPSQPEAPPATQVPPASADTPASAAPATAVPSAPTPK